jgi:hypothetical protein
VLIAAGADQPMGRSPPARWRFRLWDIFSYTTATCVLMAVVRLLEFPWAVAAKAGLFCLGLTTAALIVGWAGLASRRALLAAPAVAAAAAIGGLLAVTQAPPQPAGAVAAMLGVQGLCVACGAAVLRVGGYRFLRQPR